MRVARLRRMACASPAPIKAGVRRGDHERVGYAQIRTNLSVAALAQRVRYTPVATGSNTRTVPASMRSGADSRRHPVRRTDRTPPCWLKPLPPPADVPVAVVDGQCPVGRRLHTHPQRVRQFQLGDHAQSECSGRAPRFGGAVVSLAPVDGIRTPQTPGPRPGSRAPRHAPVSRVLGRIRVGGGIAFQAAIFPVRHVVGWRLPRFARRAGLFLVVARMRRFGVVLRRSGRASRGHVSVPVQRRHRG